MPKRTSQLLIVFPPAFPDLDGVACAFAYAELLGRQGRRAKAWFYGTPDGEAAFVLNRFPRIRAAGVIEARNAFAYIYVDGSSLEGVPRDVEPSRVIEVLDHRLRHRATQDFPNADVCVESVGAAATLVVERFQQACVRPSVKSAILLFGAIHSNTQNLKGSVTTPRDHAAANWLNFAHVIPANWLVEQFAARRDEILADPVSAIAREQKTYAHSTGSYTVAQLEFMGASERVESFQGLLPTVYRLMLNLVDVTTGESYLIIPDPALRSTAQIQLGCSFIGAVARSRPAILRKQIVAAMDGLTWSTHDKS